MIDNSLVTDNRDGHESVTAEILDFDFEDSREERVASEVIDLLYYYKIGAGQPREIVAKMRFVIQTYCTFGYSDLFDSDDSPSSIVEEFRDTGKQHPACALLDELDNISDYASGRYLVHDSGEGGADALAGRDLTALVGRALKIVNAIPNLP